MARKTVLNRIHRDFGGRMVDFAGWEMPVQYQSALEEHKAVRTAAGVFDVSHMGEVEIRGADALTFTQKMTCNDVSRLSDGQAQYSAFLTPRGTFIDDIVVYRFHERRFFICVNAATNQKDLDWLRDHQIGSVEILDRSPEFAQLAVQGPRAEKILQRLTEVDLSAIRFYWFTEGTIAGAQAIISRTGYTGEPGFEVYLSPDDAAGFWQRLFDAGRDSGLVPAGLAARNTLRLEMKYPLYGTDIDEERTPLEAGLSWIVKFGAGFVGEEELNRIRRSGVDEKLVGFVMQEPGIARDGYPVHLRGRPVSKITSGGYSPMLEKSIGLTYLPKQSSKVGQAIQIDIRGKMRAAEVVETPFYRPQE